jgi:hypothetical protein
VDTNWSAALTIANSPIAYDHVQFLVTRKATDGTDTYNGVDAWFMGMDVEITQNSAFVGATN